MELAGRLLGAGALATACLMAVPVGAGAAATLGETAASGITCNTGAQVYTEVQSSSGPGPSYTVPAGGGVITSWSHEAGPDAGQTLKLKIYRPTANPNEHSVVGQSPFETITASALNSFSTRIPVQAGDLLAYTRGPNTIMSCLFVTASAGDAVQDAPGADTADAATTSFSAPSTQLRINIAAVLEPDADGDGYGDESQDHCPSNASTQGVCPLPPQPEPPAPDPPAPDSTPPETAITGHPKQRTKSRTAHFAFSANEPATFACRLDGGELFACASPATLRVKRGRHTLTVAAIDSSENIDATPASFSWKVKKRRR
jgi:hypothetical protein